MEQIKHISGGPGGPKYMGDSGDGKSRWLDLLIYFRTRISFN